MPLNVVCLYYSLVQGNEAKSVDVILRVQANVHVSKSSVIRISSSYVGVCLGHAKSTVFPTGFPTGLNGLIPGVGVVC